MSDQIVERIQRETEIPNLLEALAERITPTDLQSLLLEVYRRRTTRISPNRLLERYEQDRFVRPSSLAPALLTEFDRLAWTLLPEGFAAVELSPVCPLGTNAAVATVDQNKIVATIRNTEVVADATNVLALECAVRRRQLLQADSHSRTPVRLCASHRMLRAQAYRSAQALAHFRLLGLCTAGRDEGSFSFETWSLREQIGFYVRLLQAVIPLGYTVGHVRVAITDLEHGLREQIIADQVLEPLRAENPGVECVPAPERAGGRGYYVGACFHIYACDAAGDEFQLIDGGFTTWTQQFLASAKERLLVSGLGTELLCSRFGAQTAGGT